MPHVLRVFIAALALFLAAALMPTAAQAQQPADAAPLIIPLPPAAHAALYTPTAAADPRCPLVVVHIISGAMMFAYGVPLTLAGIRGLSEESTMLEGPLAPIVLSLGATLTAGGGMLLASGIINVKRLDCLAPAPDLPRPRNTGRGQRTGIGR